MSGSGANLKGSASGGNGLDDGAGLRTGILQGSAFRPRDNCPVRAVVPDIQAVTAGSRAFQVCTRTLLCGPTASVEVLLGLSIIISLDSSIFGSSRLMIIDRKTLQNCNLSAASWLALSRDMSGGFH